MKTLQITFIGFLLLATAGIPSWAKAAAAIQTPRFLTALNAANNTVHHMGSPDCEDRAPAQEKLWDAHIIGENDDRQVTRHGFVAGIFRNYRAEFSGAVCGRRQVVTVAHGFLDGDRWKVNGSTATPSPKEIGKYLVHIEACNRSYQAKKVILGTKDEDANRHLDYAVIEFDEDICPEAQKVVFGQPPHDIGSEVIASGTYRNSTVPQEGGSRPVNGGVSTSLNQNLPPNGYRQYSAEGPIVGRSADPRNGQGVIHFEADQTYGGSGGPIWQMFNGRPLVRGIQVFQSNIERSGEVTNYGLEASGPFLDFLQKHCKDIEIEPGLI